MSPRRLAIASLALLLAAPALSGCVGTPQTCVSWVDFADADDMAASATLVVVGVAEPATRTIELLSGQAELHRVSIEEVRQGDFDADELWAAAPRDYCVADAPQPSEDPIPVGERVVLFLNPAKGSPAPGDLEKVDAWSTLTPHAGVLPASE
ncbi:hypothetical protein [Homoserinibacter sp. GY 40078]|uniref:hypothetical protein n=1 Tax=Homoserinibacter sp. GY 40078 TaxID=2603275 RepID=UPI0011C84298|nr:hypothetical protein [Homoserinibacter sp. GY 40078]TXK17309.1 hypothetical protein FVQ89_10710 [Homoserinibacter sp. GY 40078]